MTRRVVSGAGFVGATARPGGEIRNGNGLYRTPVEVGVAILREEAERLREVVGPRGLVAEIASGADDLVRLLEAFGFRVFASDIAPVGRGQVIDFLAMLRRPAVAIFTNPPFGLGADFIRRAAKLGVRYLALLLPSSFFQSGAGLRLWKWWRPSRRYDVTWRVDFTRGGKGRSMMHLSWFVWEGPPSPFRPLPTMALLARPA